MPLCNPPPPLPPPRLRLQLAQPPPPYLSPLAHMYPPVYDGGRSLAQCAAVWLCVALCGCLWLRVAVCAL